MVKPDLDRCNCRQPKGGVTRMGKPCAEAQELPILQAAPAKMVDQSA